MARKQHLKLNSVKIGKCDCCFPLLVESADMTSPHDFVTTKLIRSASCHHCQSFTKTNFSQFPSSICSRLISFLCFFVWSISFDCKIGEEWTKTLSSLNWKVQWKFAFASRCLHLIHSYGRGFRKLSALSAAKMWNGKWTEWWRGKHWFISRNCVGCCRHPSRSASMIVKSKLFVSW